MQPSPDDVTRDSDAPRAPAPSDEPLPARIGRYRVDRLLGRGGFGSVYLAYDSTLERPVAIKVPHRHLVPTPADAEAYLAEARMAAGLKHPQIVPVFDVGSTPEYPFFVVTEFVDGGDLGSRLSQGAMPVPLALRVAADVAGALEHAHRHGLVHRDIKPANIFLDNSGRAFVGDFGLALREQEIGTGPRHAGTPQYMSPEQARGEGHRVDGRSDIFSLGVVLYEMLAGRRPFRAATTADLLDEIVSLEARPPRQSRPEIPREAERICLKALSKRAADRHSTAGDLASDLEACLAERPATPVSSAAETRGGGATPPATPRPVSPTPSRRLTIVPKGLRSFDEGDKDFFLDLLPGPRDRDGLPDSIRFWKGRLEKEEGGDPLRVGLIYGPSGCGKSSLVKAGLLPRLSAGVRAVYLEATGSETESRLLAGLRRLVPGLPPGGTLAESFKAVRQGALPAGARRLVIVIDQFEQWLHARGGEAESELTRALRQCDGDRLQSVVMVRDDFWLAVSRFLAELEIPLREGLNARLVDLFDTAHARKVLAAYGRAHGALPPEASGASDPELAAVLSRAEAWPEKAAEAREGMIRAIDIAGRDAEMALTRIRKVLEWVVREVFEAHVGKAGTQPLEGLIDRLVKDGHFPRRLEAYAATVRKLGNMGTHGHGESLTMADVKTSLAQIEPIVAWHCGVEMPEAVAVATVADPSVHEAFLARAIDGLARDGKVVSVQVALLADMLKAKPWVPATLETLGGVEGIGVAFLEETFSAAGAPAAQRARQRPARAVLKALLPPPGTDIKGHMRSHDELFRASGLGNRPREFDDLLALLDSQLRLITPTDPEGAGAEATDAQAGGRNYILTHDYLVPSLREWLARKQRETSRGRAELLLAERASAWQANPSTRQLPYLFQWLGILRHVPRSGWSEAERRLMSAAFQTHARRAAMALVAVAALAAGGLFLRDRINAERDARLAAGMVDALEKAEMAQVLALVNDLEPYRRWADPLLRQAADDFAKPASERLRASLALLPSEPQRAADVFAALSDADPRDLPVLVEALAPRAETLREPLLEMAQGPKRLRAAAVLARLDPDAEAWKGIAKGVANDLVRENPVYLGAWSEMLRPARKSLLEPLSVVFSDTDPDRSAERSLATNLLADWAADDPSALVRLLLAADEKQFGKMFGPLGNHAEAAGLLGRVLAERLPAAMPAADPMREALALRQANAAVGLLRLGQAEAVWPWFRHSPDPRVRSYIIHRLSPLGADPEGLIRRLDQEPDISAKRALLLTLGEFGEQALPVSRREALIPRIQSIYEAEADAGLHAAAEWLLRQWKQEAWLTQVNGQWAKDTARGEEALRRAGMPGAKPVWQVNGQGQTMVLIPGPVEFRMGSPESEAYRNGDETSHQKRISRGFAIASTPVTLEQYERFVKNHGSSMGAPYDRDRRLPAVGINWFMAAAYCNWLSEQEGIEEEEWCFEITAKETRLKPDYLKRRGYRMPTEADYEYAVRAGSGTSRFYGETGDLLRWYAHYQQYGWNQEAIRQNSVIWPVGMLKPNDLGLFDMLGNVYSICMDLFRNEHINTVDDGSDIKIAISGDKNVVVRGSSFNDQMPWVRCSVRVNTQASDSSPNHGFRLARTITP